MVDVDVAVGRADLHEPRADERPLRRTRVGHDHVEIAEATQRRVRVQGRRLRAFLEHDRPVECVAHPPEDSRSRQLDGGRQALEIGKVRGDIAAGAPPRSRSGHLQPVDANPLGVPAALEQPSNAGPQLARPDVELPRRPRQVHVSRGRGCHVVSLA